MTESTKFELALIALNQEARDGKGNRVKLEFWLGVPTAEQLRTATFEFMSRFDVDAMYITTDAKGEIVESAEAEASMWDNLALLARATAAAIREKA